MASDWEKHVPHPDPEVQKYQNDYFDRVYPHTPLPDVLVRRIVEFLEPDPKPSFAFRESFRRPRAEFSHRRVGSLFGPIIMGLIAILSICFALGLLALWSWSIYIGVHTNGQLCGGKNLPLWIIVWGATAIAQFSLTCCERTARDGKGSWVTSCFGLFAGAWIIVGSVWVYPLDYYYPGCNYDLFYTVYWVVTGSWILIGSLCSVICCAFVVSNVFG